MLEKVAAVYIKMYLLCNIQHQVTRIILEYYNNTKTMIMSGIMNN